MKKATALVAFFVLCALVIFTTACSKTEQPAPASKTEVQPTPEPTKPEPPKPKVLFTSSKPFRYDSRGYYQEPGPIFGEPSSDSNQEGTRHTQSLDKEAFSKETQYVVIIKKGMKDKNGSNYFLIDYTIRLEPELFKTDGDITIDLNTVKGERLPGSGYKVRSKITSFVFRSALEGQTKAQVGTGDTAKELTFDELEKKSPFYWYLHFSAGKLIASPDEDAMLTSFTPEGIRAFLAYQTEYHPNKDEFAAIKNKDGNGYTSGYQAVYLASRYKWVGKIFDAAPMMLKGPLIDSVGPDAVRALIAQVGEELVRNYLTNLTWEQILKADPSRNPDDLSWWPHHDPDAVVGYYGMSKKQYEDTVHPMLFWQRRGRDTFERCKTVALKVLGQKK